MYHGRSKGLFPSNFYFHQRAKKTKNDDHFASLHEELMAQRALDRRLAEQLIQFKSTVGTLMLYVEIMSSFFSIYIDDFETIF